MGPQKVRRGRRRRRHPRGHPGPERQRRSSRWAPPRCTTSTWPTPTRRSRRRARRAQWHTVAGGQGRQRRHALQGAAPKTTRVFDEDVMADVDLRAAAGRARTAPAPRRRRSAGRPRARPAPRRCDRTPRRRPGSSATRRSCAAAVDFYKGTGRADLDGVGGLSTFFGGEYPARIWTAFMTAAMQGKEVEEFPPRADVGETREPAADRSDADADADDADRPTPTTDRRRRRPRPPTVVPPTDRRPRRRRPASRRRARSSLAESSNRRATARRAAEPMAAER